MKGATIGISPSGSHKGAPTIGDCVYIGLNSTVVGGITVGEDVLIATINEKGDFYCQAKEGKS